MIKKIKWLSTNGQVIGFDLYILGIKVFETNFKKSKVFFSE